MIKIRNIKDDDFPEWLSLWNANNLGHKDEAVTTQTWMRLLDDQSDVYALVAEDKGALIGLLQYVLHPTTGSIAPVCYMQDVFVLPERRGQGIAKTMIEHLERIGNREKWSRIYWLAEEKNEAAQALYKSLGQKMEFSLHILPIKS